MSSASSNPPNLQLEHRHQQSSHSSLASLTHGPIHGLTLGIKSRILHYAVTPAIDSFEDEASIIGDGAPTSLNTYYPGRVCSAWHAIFLHTPSPWTRIVAFVDTPHTAESLATSPLQRSLHRSFPLPISVYLRRKVTVSLDLDLEEVNSTRALFAALKDYFGRAEVLVVEANLASTLPDALNILVGGSEVFPLPLKGLKRGLKSLVLRCNTGDSILQSSAPSTLLQPIFSPPLLHISLKTLYLDGRSLLKMLRSSVCPNGLGLEDVFGNMIMLETPGVNDLTSRVDGFSEELIHYSFFDVVS